MCRVTTSSHLLSSCCHRPSRVSQVRPHPDGLPAATTELPLPLTPCVPHCLPRPATDAKSIPATSANPGSSSDLPAPGRAAHTGECPLSVPCWVHSRACGRLAGGGRSWGWGISSSFGPPHSRRGQLCPVTSLLWNLRQATLSGWAPSSIEPGDSAGPEVLNPFRHVDASENVKIWV